MFQLFIPFYIGLSFGISPDAGPAESVTAVTVEVHHDDGTVEAASFVRPAILMP